ncbi:MAG: hypothetical protein IKQ04_07045 [Oscillospiraceae bacterium]|nr:hypothetical protein [Oscillospiraceae bacterium]
MRRRWMIFAVPMMTLCLLCACGGKEQNPLRAPMDFRAELLARGGCAFELAARSEAGDRLWELELACELDAEGNGSVTVLAPESIAGIRAVLEGGKGSLRYGELSLGLGKLPGTELAPAAAPGALVRAWARDWIASAGPEEEGLLVCYGDGPLTVRTCFDAGGVPLRAELLVEGRTRFSAEIRKFEWKAKEHNETTEENLG